ncbi:hypothetical protein LTR81_027238 [Elasticomyces elasticus]
MGARTAFDRRQASRFDPNPASGFDDPTVDIADPSFGTAIATGYQGPMAGQVNLGGLPNYTLPLYQSSSLSNETYWWIVTDSSDEGNAQQLGINFSPKLRFATQDRTLDGVTGAEEVRIVNNTVGGRRGVVDFYPVRDIVPGHPSPFPPSHVQPGSVGDRFYTPLIQLTNGGGEIWNAPIVAGDVTEEYLNQFCDVIPPEMLQDFRSKVHDQVCGPYGSDDALFSGVERFFVCTNGYTDADLPPGAPNNETHHPWRQELDSRILGEVTYDYSPLWNFELFTWTNYSIVNGIRTRLTAEFEVLGMAAAGYVTDPNGDPLSDAKIISNCPMVYRYL